jgi:hypothetical protein
MHTHTQALSVYLYIYLAKTLFIQRKTCIWRAPILDLTYADRKLLVADVELHDDNVECCQL